MKNLTNNIFSSFQYLFADVISQNDYYPFGMLLPNRHEDAGEYRYGFNGMEKDDEVKGEGNSYTTHFRQLDVRVARWLSIDPKATPWESPYVSMGNNPIMNNDPLGDTIVLSSDMTYTQRQEYYQRIEVLCESDIFRYYYNNLQNSEEVITVGINDKPKGSGHFNPATNEVNYSDRGHLSTYVVGQELFHAYQVINGYYNLSTDRSTIETEGDIVSYYVTAQGGFPAASPSSWMDDINSAYGLYTVPSSEEVSSEEYTTLFNDAVDQRIQYYIDKSIQQEAGDYYNGYTNSNSETEPKATQKVIKEAEALNLAGPRLPNGDYYED